MAYVPLQLVESGDKCGEDCEADSSLQLPGMISMHCYWSLNQIPLDINVYLQVDQLSIWLLFVPLPYIVACISPAIQCSRGREQNVIYWNQVGSGSACKEKLWHHWNGFFFKGLDGYSHKPCRAWICDVCSYQLLNSRTYYSRPSEKPKVLDTTSYSLYF